MWLSIISISIIFIIFLALLYALLTANYDEERNLEQYEWVRDEFKEDYHDV